jgi:hypothetical protein
MVSLDSLKILEETAKILGGWDKLQARLQVSRQCVWLWQTGSRNPRAETVLTCIAICQRSEASRKRHREERESLEAEFS